MITIIDYGMGNLRSVEKIFQRLNIPNVVSSSIKAIENAEKLLLPGVGHFENGMSKLRSTNILEILNQKVIQDKTPILGICLGMQLMTKNSTEGDVEGLGWVDAQTTKFNFDSGKLKIPHMGWNQVSVMKDSIMARNITLDNDLFYFVHSYFVSCNRDQDVLFQSEYGNTFVSGFEKDNITGVQFHPEKSHRSGIQVIRNFADLKT